MWPLCFRNSASCKQVSPEQVFQMNTMAQCFGWPSIITCPMQSLPVKWNLVKALSCGASTNLTAWDCACADCGLCTQHSDMQLVIGSTPASWLDTSRSQSKPHRDGRPLNALRELGCSLRCVKKQLETPHVSEENPGFCALLNWQWSSADDWALQI